LLFAIGVGWQRKVAHGTDGNRIDEWWRHVGDPIAQTYDFY
jgi:hypothetical protein